MKSVKMFFLPDCPYCRKADKAIIELRSENPHYEKILIERIDEHEQLAIAELFDYYYVPVIFFGDEKLYEAKPGQSYEEIRDHIRDVFDKILEDSLL